MKRPLRIFSALTFAAVLCAGQVADVSAPAGPAAATAAPPAPEVIPEAAGAAAAPAQAKPEAPSPASEAAPKGKTTDAAPKASANARPAGSPKPYVIGSLDVLDIRVWNNQNVSGIFDVGPDGTMSMPLIGEVKADGLTVLELRDVVKSKLSAFLNNPEVNVQVAKNNSKRFFVFGGVGRPGEYPLTAETTLLEAFANCGGFRDFANTKKIYVLRGDKRFMFNYKDVSHGKHMDQNIVLENGDKIFVPE